MGINYSNLHAMMKRHNLTINDIAKVTGQSYPPTQRKIAGKTAKDKTALFDIIEARRITDYLIQTEKRNLKEKFGESWEEEWEKRWGHISNWFNYLFFDEVVTNVDSPN